MGSLGGGFRVYNWCSGFGGVGVSDVITAISSVQGFGLGISICILRAQGLGLGVSDCINRGQGLGFCKFTRTCTQAKQAFTTDSFGLGFVVLFRISKRV